MIFPCHSFLGSSKKTFKNFSVNNSSHNDYSVLLPQHFSWFVFLWSSVDFWLHNILWQWMPQLIIWKVGGKVPSLCFLLHHISWDVLWFGPFPHWSFPEITLYAWPSLLSSPLKVSFCFIFEDWRTKSLRITARSIEEFGAVYKSTVMPFCFVFLS